jgi:hypothetical protein
MGWIDDIGNWILPKANQAKNAHNEQNYIMIQPKAEFMM